MAETGLQEVETYVPCRHNTVAQFIATRPIMKLCMAEEQSLGPRLAKWWWDKGGMDLEGMRMAAR